MTDQKWFHNYLTIVGEGSIYAYGHKGWHTGSPHSKWEDCQYVTHHHCNTLCPKWPKGQGLVPPQRLVTETDVLNGPLHTYQVQSNKAILHAEAKGSPSGVSTTVGTFKVSASGGAGGSGGQSSKFYYSQHPDDALLAGAPPAPPSITPEMLTKLIGNISAKMAPPPAPPDEKLAQQILEVCKKHDVSMSPFAAKEIAQEVAKLAPAPPPYEAKTFQSSWLMPSIKEHKFQINPIIFKDEAYLANYIKSMVKQVRLEMLSEGWAPISNPKVTTFKNYDPLMMHVVFHTYVVQLTDFETMQGKQNLPW